MTLTRCVPLLVTLHILACGLGEPSYGEACDSNSQCGGDDGFCDDGSCTTRCECDGPCGDGAPSSDCPDSWECVLVEGAFDTWQICRDRS